MNFKQIKAIEKKNKERILKLCPIIQDVSGIYIFHRIDEQGFKFYYCGQSKHLLTRLAQHFTEYDHIALSLKKRKLITEQSYGWDIEFIYCPELSLDLIEKTTIDFWHKDKGYIPYNKTSGGQGVGKTGIAENKPSKGYYDGIKQGYKNAKRDVG